MMRKIEVREDVVKGKDDRENGDGIGKTQYCLILPFLTKNLLISKINCKRAPLTFETFSSVSLDFSLHKHTHPFHLHLTLRDSLTLVFCHSKQVLPSDAGCKWILHCTLRPR